MRNKHAPHDEQNRPAVGVPVEREVRAPHPKREGLTMNPVTVTMPLALSQEMLRAVKEHDTTKTEDRDEWHRRLGWLLCAWDVLVEHRRQPPEDEVSAAFVAGFLCAGGDVAEARNQAAQFLACVSAGKTPNVGANQPWPQQEQR